jgi:N-acetylmuramoyl-L-alanine amidase
MSVFKRRGFSFLVFFIFLIGAAFAEEAFLPGKEELSRTKGDGTAPFTVVIDPGHGGEDQGAVGTLGLTEKEITLRLSEMLKEFLSERLGAAVILTRTGDEFRSADERAAVANTNKADVFISIHADAGFDTKKNGIRVFHFDPEYYRKSNPAFLSDKEQKALFWDRVQYKFLNKSKNLAGSIYQSLDEQAISEKRWISKAALSILKTVKMPAVMVSIGYLSNTEEEIRLKDVVYLTKIAEGISIGLEQYKRGKEDKNNATPKS